MEEDKKEIIVGLTVIIGVIILVAGILWGKGDSIFSKKIIFKADFSSAEGLKPGDNVVVRGVKCGRVKSVSLRSKGVRVGFWVKENIRLYSDMKLSIAGLEMMGGKALVINPGESSKQADPEIVYKGITVPGVDKLLAQVTNVVSITDSVLSKISSVVDVSKIEESASAFNSAVKGLTLMISENRESLKATVNNMNEMSSVLKADSSAERFSQLISRADSTMKLLQYAVKMITEGNGTLGKMMKDSTLYIQIVKTSRELDSLVADLKKHPSKYVHVSIF